MTLDFLLYFVSSSCLFTQSAQSVWMHLRMDHVEMKHLLQKVNWNQTGLPCMNKRPGLLSIICNQCWKIKLMLFHDHCTCNMLQWCINAYQSTWYCSWAAAASRHLHHTVILSWLQYIISFQKQQNTSLLDQFRFQNEGNRPIWSYLALNHHVWGMWSKFGLQKLKMRSIQNLRWPTNFAHCEGLTSCTHLPNCEVSRNCTTTFCWFSSTIPPNLGRRQSAQRSRSNSRRVHEDCLHGRRHAATKPWPILKGDEECIVVSERHWNNSVVILKVGKCIFVGVFELKIWWLHQPQGQVSGSSYAIF